MNFKGTQGHLQNSIVSQQFLNGTSAHRSNVNAINPLTHCDRLG